MILRLFVLSIASELLYLLLGRESSLPVGASPLASWYHPVRFEETVVFYAIWAALFLVYGLAIRTTSRMSGRTVVAVVFLTSALFRGTILWKSGFDTSVPHAFLQGPSPLRVGETALSARLDSWTRLPVNPGALAVSLVDLGTLAIAPGLLRAASLPAGLLIVQGWNPLLIKEVAGNARIEAALVFFLFLAFRLAQRGRPTLAALAYGLSLTGPILPLWATIPLLGRVLRLRLVLSLLVAGGAWGLLSSASPSSLELVGWPPQDSMGGSLLPVVTLLNRLLLTRNELVSLSIGAGVLLLIASFRTLALRPGWGNLPKEALVVSGFSLFLAPQVFPWSFLPIAALAAFSENRGWLWFTATAPLTYLGLGAGRWNFWVGFTQYFPAYASLIYRWLGGEPSARAQREAEPSREARSRGGGAPRH